MSRYISKFSIYDTHFKRTDPFPFNEWAEDEPQSPLWLKILAGGGMVLVLIVLLFTGGLS